MKILAIESSCDETACSIVEDGRNVLSNVVYTQIAIHKEYGGVVPEIASRKHIEKIGDVVQAAISQANLNKYEIDAVAVTYAPGLIGALLTGISYAKALAFGLNIPIIPVHHLRGHIAANYLTDKELKPPFLALVVSGGHSHIVKVDSYVNYEVIGRTRDDAAGECMDKAARAMGLPYPGGVNLDRISVDGDASLYKLPHPKVEGSEYDFSFSGLKTAVVNIIHNSKQKGIEVSIPDLGASCIETVADCLVNNTVKAAETYGFDKIVLAGGVSANSRLRKRMTDVCTQKGWQLYMPELSLCGDNAAMVGAQAFYEFQSGNIAGLELNAFATMPIDEQNR